MASSRRHKQAKNPTRLLVSVMLLLAARLVPASGLEPYDAVYESDLKGFNVHVKRSLEVTDNGVIVSIDARRFMFALHEESRMTYVSDSVLRPSSYVHNRKGFGNEHDKDLRFNWDDDTVTDLLNPKREPLEVEDPCYDKLGYQTQIRLDLMQDPNLERKEYFVSNSIRNRVYTIVRVGEEVLDTPLGKLNTIKLKREGGAEDREVLVWVAPDWDYLLVRMDQTKKAGGRMQSLLLKSATIAGRSVTALVDAPEAD